MSEFPALKITDPNQEVAVVVDDLANKQPTAYF